MPTYTNSYKNFNTNTCHVSCHYLIGELELTINKFNNTYQLNNDNSHVT